MERDMEKIKFCGCVKNGGKIYLNFLAEIPFIPFLHVSMDFLFPFLSREFSNLESRIFQACNLRSQSSTRTPNPIHKMLALITKCLLEIEQKQKNNRFKLVFPSHQKKKKRTNSQSMNFFLVV